MWNEQDLDAAERQIDDWQTGLQEQAAKAAELSRRIGELSGKARSGDGLVEITVSSVGLMTDLQLDERIRKQSAAQTARQILTVLGQAQAALSKRVAETTADTVGVDDPTGQAIVNAYASRLAATQAEAGHHGGQ